MAIRTIRNLGLVLAVVFLLIAGTVACNKTEEAVNTAEGQELLKNQLAIEGTVKVIVGQYMFVPEVRGFDIVVPGALVSGELSDLVNKEIKGTASYTPDRPSVLVPEELEVKDENGNFSLIFTKSEEPVLDDYMSVAQRDEFEKLEQLEYNKAEDWEGKTRVKVYGRVETTETGHQIVLTEENGDEIGATIILDSMTDFADYYIKKLRLFKEFWCYINIKETVDWSTRRRSRELFHADLLFAGLF